MADACGTIPIRRAALCLEHDCERVFSVENRRCPSCGSSKFMPLERLIGRVEGAVA